MTNKGLKNLIADIAQFIGVSHERYFSHPFPATISAKKIADGIKDEEMVIIPLQAVGSWIPFREFQINFTNLAKDTLQVRIEIYSEKNGELEQIKAAEKEFNLKDYN